MTRKSSTKSSRVQTRRLDSGVHEIVAAEGRACCPNPFGVVRRFERPTLPAFLEDKRSVADDFVAGAGGIAGIAQIHGAGAQAMPVC